MMTRNLFFIIIAVITFIVMMLNYPIANSLDEGLVIASASFTQPEIGKGENTTLLIIIDNRAPSPLFFELQISYSNNAFQFFDNITGQRFKDIAQYPTNYTLTHPVKGVLDISTTLPILLTAATPKGLSETYEFAVKVYGVEGNQRILFDEQALPLTVTHA